MPPKKTSGSSSATADPAVDPAKAPAAGAQLGYSTIRIPSRGVLYDGKLPQGAVQMRQMRSGEMARLQGQGGNVVAKIEAVVNACVKLPSELSSKDLLLSDHFFLMLALRTMTFGPKYNYKFRCQYCGSVERATVDIAKDLDEKPAADDLVEPFEVTLKDAGCVAGCRLLRASDQDLVVKHTTRMKMSTADKSDPSFAYRLALALEERDGEPFSDVLVKQDFIKGLTAADTIRLERGISEKEPGVDIRVFPVCSACDAAAELTLPFDAEFFRPSSL